MGAQVTEVAVYWYGDLLSVRYVPVGHGDLAAPEGPGIVVRTTRVDAAPRVGRQPIDGRQLASVVFAALGHALLLGAIAWNAHARGEAAGAAREDIDLMRSYLANAEHAEREAAYAGHGDETSGLPGGTGARPTNDEGAMGDAASRSNGRYAVARRESEGDEPASLAEARTFGMIGLLERHDTVEASEWATPQRDVNGALWGSAIDDAFGVGGIALSGVGLGGGGDGGGIGLGTIGTIGRGAGRGRGEDSGPGGAGGTCDDTCVGIMGKGMGRGGSLSFSGRRNSPIVCRLTANATVTGRLPPEAIQRVVHQSFGRFRACYEQGLVRDPTLSGRVSTKFVIARDGSVSTAVDAGSDLPNTAVSSCVHRTFEGLAFPEPAGGVVTVVYPITFAPQ